MTGRPWTIVQRGGDAATLHAIEPAEDDDRRVWVCAVDRPALVLGSTQDDTTVRRDRLAAHGIALVRRRSGGGAVLLQPEQSTWIDVVLTRADPLVVDDVSQSFDWLGATWERALLDLGVEPHRHTGPLVRTEWSDLVCFAGVGPGEVLLGERKVVGLSQRRTRAHVRFQCIVHHTWQPDALLACFDLSDADRDRAAAEIAAAALPVPAAALVDAFVASLPS
jgi:lipoate-protein ligase A